MIPEIAIQKANGAKKEAINGWWPCASLVVPYVINKEWPHLPELLDILRAYRFEDYHHSYSGNAQRDYEKQIAQEEEIKRKLQEKRDRLMSLQSENARLKALLAQMESKLNEKEKEEAKAPVNCVIPLLDDSKVKPYKNVDISSMDMAAIIQQESEIERKRKEEFWEMMKICDNEVPDKSFTLDELMIELNEEYKQKGCIE